MAESADVLVVGAGIAGAATAWSLTRRGVGRVVVVDPRPPLSLTSNRPEANYRTWWPQPAMVALAERSLELIDELRTGGAVIPMDRRGYLFVSDQPATASTLAAVVAGHPATGASRAEAVDFDALHDRWPHLGPTVLGGIFVATAGSLDTVALGGAMLAGAQDGGAEIVRGRLTRVEVERGRVVGAIVTSAQGDTRIATNVLVNAAGPFARDIARLAGLDLPLETVLRQKAVVDDRAGAIPRDAPFTITLDGRAIEGRPMPAGTHIKPDDTAGPHALKIGWAFDQTPMPPSEDPPLPNDFPRLVLAAASAIVPALPNDAPVVVHEGGFYARTPDGLPLIGAMGDGFFAVAGLAGFGAMMAAAAGEIAAAAMTGEKLPDYAAAFNPSRQQIRPAATGEL